MKTVIRIVYAVLHGFLMALLLLLLFRYPFLIDDETKLNKWTLIARDYLFHDTTRTKQFLQEFVFIDVDGDLELVNRNHGQGYQVAVTNRNDLSRAFHLLKKVSEKKPIRGILVNLLFEDHSSNDSTLYHSLLALQSPTFYPAAYDASTKSPAKGIFKLKNVAIASFWPSDETYYKYSYIAGDGSPSLPLLIYSQINGLTVHTDPLFFYLGKHAYIRSFTTGLHLQNGDLHTKHSAFFTLRELAERDSVSEYIPEMVTDLQKDGIFDHKLVLIGSFTDKDQHKTALEKISGPLILANAYIDLELQANRFRLGMVFYLVAVFSIFSYVLFYGAITDLAKMRARYQLIGLFPKKYIRFSFFLLLISIFNFLLFGTHISIIIPGLYLTLVWYLLRHFKLDNIKEKVKNLFEKAFEFLKLPHT